jgi:hypothetical protein
MRTDVIIDGAGGFDAGDGGEEMTDEQFSRLLTVIAVWGIMNVIATVVWGVTIMVKLDK